MGTDRSIPPQVRWSPLIAIASLIAGALLLVLVGQALLPFGMRTAIMGSELALVAPGLAFFALARVPLGPWLGLHPISRSTFVLAVATALTLWVASLGLIELQFTLWPPSLEYVEAFRRIHEALRPRGALDAIVSLVTIALLPAVCEETLLRGMVLPSFFGLGPRGAVFVSAFLFAIIHFDLNRLVFTLVLGLALGILRLRSGSLLTPITVHAVINTATFVSVPFLDPPTAELPDPRPGLGAVLLVLGSVLTALLMRRFRPLTHLEATPRLDT